MVYPTSDQKAERIAHLLVEEIVPFFGVPEALPSDREMNLLSHLMKDICKLLGIKKLNTTALECDGLKPSYLLFGMDCRTPTEAALLPPS